MLFHFIFVANFIHDKNPLYGTYIQTCMHKCIRMCIYCLILEAICTVANYIVALLSATLKFFYHAVIHMYISSNSLPVVFSLHIVHHVHVCSYMITLCLESHTSSVHILVASYLDQCMD